MALYEEDISTETETRVPCGITHFVELIDATYPVIRQDKSSRFQNHITCLRISAEMVRITEEGDLPDHRGS